MSSDSLTDNSAADAQSPPVKESKGTVGRRMLSPRNLKKKKPRNSKNADMLPRISRPTQSGKKTAKAGTTSRAAKQRNDRRYTPANGAVESKVSPFAQPLPSIHDWRINGAGPSAARKRLSGPTASPPRSGPSHNRRQSAPPLLPNIGSEGFEAPNPYTNLKIFTNDKKNAKNGWVPPGPGNTSTLNDGISATRLMSPRNAKAAQMGRDLYRDIAFMRSQLASSPRARNLSPRARSPTRSPRRLTKSQDGYLAAQFGHYDTDNNGVISRSELQRMLKSIGMRERYGPEFMAFAASHLSQLFSSRTPQVPFDRLFGTFMQLHTRWSTMKLQEREAKGKTQIRRFDSPDLNKDGVASISELNEAAYTLRLQNQRQLELVQQHQRDRAQSEAASLNRARQKHLLASERAAEDAALQQRLLEERTVRMQERRELERELHAQQLVAQEELRKDGQDRRQKIRALDRLRLAIDQCGHSRETGPLEQALRFARENGVDRDNRGNVLVSEGDALLAEIQAENSSQDQRLAAIATLRQAYDHAQRDRNVPHLEAALEVALENGVEEASGLVRRCRRLLESLLLGDVQNGAVQHLANQVQLSRENRELAPLQSAYQAALASGLDNSREVMKDARTLLQALLAEEKARHLAEQELDHAAAMHGPRRDVKALAVAITKALQVPGMASSLSVQNAKDLVKRISMDLRETSNAAAVLHRLIDECRETRDLEALRVGMMAAEAAGVRKVDPVMSAARKLFMQLDDLMKRSSELRAQLRALVTAAKAALESQPGLRMKLCEVSVAAFDEAMADPLVQKLGPKEVEVAEARDMLDLLHHEIERIHAAAAQLASATSDCESTRNWTQDLDKLVAAITKAADDCVPKDAQAMASALTLKDELTAARRKALRATHNLQLATEEANKALSLSGRAAGKFRALKDASTRISSCLGACDEIKIGVTEFAYSAGADAHKRLKAAIELIISLADDLHGQTQEAADTREGAPLQAALDRAIDEGILQSDPAPEDETEANMVYCVAEARELLEQLNSEAESRRPLDDLQKAVIAAETALVASTIGSRAGDIASALEVLQQCLARAEGDEGVATNVTAQSLIAHAKTVKEKLSNALVAIHAADSELQAAISKCQTAAKAYVEVEDVERASRLLQQALDKALAAGVPQNLEDPTPPRTSSNVVEALAVVKDCENIVEGHEICLCLLVEGRNAYHNNQNGEEARAAACTKAAAAIADGLVELREERFKGATKLELDDLRRLAARLNGVPAEAGVLQEVEKQRGLLRSPDPKDEATTSTRLANGKAAVAQALEAGFEAGLPHEPRHREYTGDMPLLDECFVIYEDDDEDTGSSRGDPTAYASTSDVVKPAHAFLRATTLAGAVVDEIAKLIEQAPDQNDSDVNGILRPFQNAIESLLARCDFPDLEFECPELRDLHQLAARISGQIAAASESGAVAEAEAALNSVTHRCQDIVDNYTDVSEVEDAETMLADAIRTAVAAGVKYNQEDLTSASTSAQMLRAKELVDTCGEIRNAHELLSALVDRAETALGADGSDQADTAHAEGGASQIDSSSNGSQNASQENTSLATTAKDGQGVDSAESSYAHKTPRDATDRTGESESNSSGTAQGGNSRDNSDGKNIETGGEHNNASGGLDASNKERTPTAGDGVEGVDGHDSLDDPKEGRTAAADDAVVDGNGSVDGSRTASADGGVAAGESVHASSGASTRHGQATAAVVVLSDDALQELADVTAQVESGLDSLTAPATKVAAAKLDTDALAALVARLKVKIADANLLRVVAEHRDALATVDDPTIDESCGSAAATEDTASTTSSANERSKTKDGTSEVSAGQSPSSDVRTASGHADGDAGSNSMAGDASNDQSALQPSPGSASAENEANDDSTDGNRSSTASANEASVAQSPAAVDAASNASKKGTKNQTSAGSTSEPRADGLDDNDAAGTDAAKSTTQKLAEARAAIVSALSISFAARSEAGAPAQDSLTEYAGHSALPDAATGLYSGTEACIRPAHEFLHATVRADEMLKDVQALLARAPSKTLAADATTVAEVFKPFVADSKALLAKCLFPELGGLDCPEVRQLRAKTEEVKYRIREWQNAHAEEAAKAKEMAYEALHSAVAQGQGYLGEYSAIDDKEAALAAVQKCAAAMQDALKKATAAGIPASSQHFNDASDLLAACERVQKAHSACDTLAERGRSAIDTKTDVEGQHGRDAASDSAARAAASDSLEAEIAELMQQNKDTPFASSVVGKKSLDHLNHILRQLKGIAAEEHLLKVIEEELQRLRHVEEEEEEGTLRSSRQGAEESAENPIVGDTSSLVKGSRDRVKAALDAAFASGVKHEPHHIGYDGEEPLPGEPKVAHPQAHHFHHDEHHHHKHHQRPHALLKRRLQRHTSEHWRQARKAFTTAVAAAFARGKLQKPAAGNGPWDETAYAGAAPSVWRAHAFLRAAVVGRDVVNDCAKLLARTPKADEDDLENVLQPLAADIRAVLRRCEFPLLGLDCPEVRRLQQLHELLTAQVRDVLRKQAAMKAKENAKQTLADLQKELALIEEEGVGGDRWSASLVKFMAANVLAEATAAKLSVDVATSDRDRIKKIRAEQEKIAHALLHGTSEEDEDPAPLGGDDHLEPDVRRVLDQASGMVKKILKASRDSLRSSMTEVKNATEALAKGGRKIGQRLSQASAHLDQLRQELLHGAERGNFGSEMGGTDPSVDTAELDDAEALAEEADGAIQMGGAQLVQSLFRAMRQKRLFSAAKEEARRATLDQDPDGKLDLSQWKYDADSNKLILRKTVRPAPKKIKTLNVPDAEPDAADGVFHLQTIGLGTVLRTKLALMRLRPAGGRAFNPDDEEYDSLEEKFLAAVEQDDLATVKECLAAGVDLDCRNLDGYNAIMIAASFDCTDVVPALVEAKVDLNMVAPNETTATILCGYTGHNDCLTAMFAACRKFDVPMPDLEAELSNGCCALYLAAQEGCTESLLTLMRAKADTQHESLDQITPLFVAIHEGHVEAVQALVDEVSMNKKNVHGLTPLYVGVQNHSDEVIDLLLDLKADPNVAGQDESTPAEVAVFSGQDNVLQSLLKAKVDANHARSVDGNSLMMLAAYKGELDMVHDIHGAGGNVAHTNLNGQCVRDVLLSLHGKHLFQVGLPDEESLLIASENNDTAVVDECLKLGTNIDCRNRDGLTPLALSCYFNSVDVAKRLIHDKADPNIHGANGASCLILSVNENHADIVEALVSTYAADDLDQTHGMSHNCTALYLACQEGHDAMVDLLLQHSTVALNICKDGGVSPLYISCHEGHEKCVRKLLEHKAEVNIRNDRGATPLYIAVQKNHTPICHAMLDAGGDPNIVTNANSSPLAIAVFHFNPKIVATLLARGAFIDVKAEDGNTEAMLAAYSLDVDILCQMILHGSSLNIENEHLLTIDNILRTTHGVCALDVAFYCLAEHRELLALSSGVREDLETITQLFKSIDVDGDEEITQDELKESLVNWGLKSKYGKDFDRFVSAEFDRLNQNGDSSVSFREFRACFSRFHLLFRSQEQDKKRGSIEVAQQGLSTPAGDNSNAVFNESVPGWMRTEAERASQHLWTALQNPHTMPRSVLPENWRTYIIDERIDHIGAENKGSILEHRLGFEVEEISGWADEEPESEELAAVRKKYEAMGHGDMPPKLPLKGDIYLRVSKVDEEELSKHNAPPDHMRVGDIIMSFFERDVEEIHSRDDFLELCEDLPVCYLGVYRPPKKEDEA